MERNEDVLYYSQQRTREKFYYEIVLNQYQQEYHKNPEDVLCEKERLSEIIEFILWTKSILSKKQWDVFRLYTVENWTQEQIARKYNVSQRAISYQFKTIYKKIQKNLLKNDDKWVRIMKDTLIPSESRLEVYPPRVKIAYPGDFFEEINAGGSWRKNVFTSRTKCAIPEYLQECFKSKNVKCSKCFTQWGENRCSRKKDIA